MNEPFSIVPPPDLVQQWVEKWHRTLGLVECRYEYIATQAAQWGADAELNYCCDELSSWGSKGMAERLRSDRRPKPMSLKEQALLQLDTLNADLAMHGRGCDLSQIRRALESLND
jgi:hypothetical protein